MMPQTQLRGFRLQAEGTKLAIALLAVLVFTAQAPRPSPFVSALDEIAQRQLKARAATIAAIKDTAAAQARNAAVRERVLSLLGGLPDYRGPLNARVTKTTPRDGYVIEHVHVRKPARTTYVTANLYRPDRAGRHPAVLMSMGHWESGKAAGQLLAVEPGAQGASSSSPTTRSARASGSRRTTRASAAR